MLNLNNFLVALTIALYIVSRICDNMAWQTWDGISTDGLQFISLGCIAASTLISICRRICEQGGVKLLFWQSQLRFIISWALCISSIVLVFNIFGCHSQLSQKQLSAADYFMDIAGCASYAGVILITNLNYSLFCNIKGDLPIIIVFQIVLFGQILYSGTLLVKLVGLLHDKEKDFAILFVSIVISWYVIVMDLLFRGAYQQKQNIQRHEELHNLVIQHHLICNVISQQPIINRQIQEEGGNRIIENHPQGIIQQEQEQVVKKSIAH